LVSIRNLENKLIAKTHEKNLFNKKNCFEGFFIG